MRTSLCFVGALVATGVSSSVRAAVLYEDISYWLPGGSTVINPVNPPTNAYVKIQETVYDDAQGRAILAQQLQFGLVNGNPIPAAPFELYGYSITNMSYDNGPFTGVGAGVSGFNIPNTFNASVLGIWGPNAANSRWRPAPGNQPFPANFEWDIDGNNNQSDGDGIGILLGQTHNSFYFAVPAGTQHGFIDGAWVHTWSGAGALEQPAAAQADLVFGRLSGPIPAPGAFGLLGLAGIAACRRRR